MPAAIATRRLPGIRFESQAPPLEDVLPRMDIAAFVGFAETGPVDVPVVIEDMAQFGEVFGAEVSLLWDAARGEDVRGFLAPAVRAFFRGGGVRCWVVRVTARAKRDQPPGGHTFKSTGARARLPLSGMVEVWKEPSAGNGRGLDLGGGATIAQAELAARAIGSWGDHVRVAAGLVVVPIRIVQESPPLAFASSITDPDVRFRLVGRPPVQRGDMLRLTFGDRVQLLCVADTITPAETIVAGEDLTTEVTGVRSMWLTTPVIPSPPPSMKGRTWLDAVGDEVPVLAAPGPEQVPGSLWLTVAVSTELVPPPGSMVPIGIDGLGTGVFSVEQVRAIRPLGESDDSSPPGDPAAEASPPGSSPPSPPLAEAATVLSGRMLLCTSVRPPSVDLLALDDSAEILRLEVRARVGREQMHVMSDLGFSSLHSRYVGLLPSDEQLYAGRLSVDDPPQAQRSLWEEAGRPRFPLSGAGPGGPVLYPVDPSLLTGNSFLGSRHEQAWALDRDGLGCFDASLFLDPDLIGVGTAALAETADFLRYRSPVPRKLVGIHALMGIDEVTLVAVPDAAHWSWRRADVPSLPSAPGHEPYIGGVPCRVVHRYYKNEEIYQEASRSTEIVSPPSVGDSSSQDEGGAIITARREGSDFEDRQHRPTKAPESLQAVSEALGTIRLRWDPIEHPGAEYVLEESLEPWSWASAAEVYRGPSTSTDLYGRSPGSYCYRVRAEVQGSSSDWSVGAAVGLPRGEPWVRDGVGVATSPPDPRGPTLAEDALDVHRSLVRMCAARGDMLAVLSVPSEFREKDVIAHADALRGDRRAGDRAGLVPSLAGEQRALSFGALYHPWTITARGDRLGQVRPIPPDGAVAGVLASRALLRGAWVAPANDPIADVVALSPTAAMTAYGDLQRAQVNVLRHEPRGFLWLSADTLSDDPDLRHVNVRRLLSLLRRVALRYGPTYVFEPNDDVFRRRVRRTFEEVLDLMLERGAFAGRSRAESYRVSTSSPPNTPASLDQGQLIVELKVAPSFPMRFLTVRVVRSGDQGINVGGA